ncbi:hypothetical protein BBJ28_00009725, partial [Nothophytophthora sp. Chile5]
MKKLLLAVALAVARPGRADVAATPVSRVIPLDVWTFRTPDGSVHVENAKAPGTSHVHLMEAGVIGDPYFRFNEREYEWIAKETWVYETQ